MKKCKNEIEGKCAKYACSGVVELCVQHGQDNTGCDAVNTWMAGATLFWLDTDGLKDSQRFGAITSLVSSRSVCAVFGGTLRDTLTRRRALQHQETWLDQHFRAADHGSQLAV